MAASRRARGDADVNLATFSVRRPGTAILGPLLLIIASLWLAAAIRGSLSGSPAVIPGLGSFGPYLAAAVGIALALLAAHWLLGSHKVALIGGELVVSERSLLRRRTWREPFASYREIRCAIERRQHRYGRRSWYVVLLWHPDRGKRVELARDREPGAIEERARDCARRLGLPLVWEQPPAAVAAPAGAPVADRPLRAGAAGEVDATPLTGRSVSAS